ncbi:MAG: stage II sporulation protein R [Lachnospiraceae bacterium]|nr:stage II sporulation protein R [Lachnospiraceae bacterium]
MKKYMMGVAAAALGCALLLTGIRGQLLQQGISGKILRFHVLANSDSSEDQTLKLQVRDAVGVYMSDRLETADSLEESETIVEENLSGIEEVAAEVIQAAGYDYPVTASLETALFPEKTYGSFTFPAGTYEALRIVIGEGEGHNWWCVMYPNLCFSGSLYEVDEESGEMLRAELTAEEYAAVFSEGDYEVEFKILKFLNQVLE